MRLSEPRIPPAPEAEWTDEQRDVLAPFVARGRVLNIFRTLANHPSAMKAFLAYGNHVLGRDNTLPRRERELVILRIGYLCRAGYEWAQHGPIGVQCGLTWDEVERIKSGPDASGWSDLDRALLRAADELHHDQFIGEATWTALRAHLDDKQCVDLIFTVGQYTQVSMLLNSLGVQLDPGQTLDPDLKAG
jgi:uncharacterized peroxidase-related enzyme